MSKLGRVVVTPRAALAGRARVFGRLARIELVVEPRCTLLSPSRVALTLRRHDALVVGSCVRA